jgi:hypothetical protein
MLEKPVIRKSRKRRIHGSRGESGLPRQLIAVAPPLGVPVERAQKPSDLLGGVSWSAHASSVSFLDICSVTADRHVRWHRVTIAERHHSQRCTENRFDADLRLDLANEVPSATRRTRLREQLWTC